ncbi:MAG: hypothetical protein HYV67_04575 [Candidatus Taylorbacteria bacterium]|nr:hypothetical protein [Candidatus Taylorbacteria bacterium]
MQYVLPFAAYTAALGFCVFLGYRIRRFCRKHWCPNHKRFTARVQYVREVLPGEPGGVYSRRRLCYTRKVCDCGFEEVITPCYLKTFTAKDIVKGERRADVVNI